MGRHEDGTDGPRTETSALEDSIWAMVREKRLSGLTKVEEILQIVRRNWKVVASNGECGGRILEAVSRIRTGDLSGRNWNSYSRVATELVDLVLDSTVWDDEALRVEPVEKAWLPFRFARLTPSETTVQRLYQITLRVAPQMFDERIAGILRSLGQAGELRVPGELLRELINLLMARKWHMFPDEVFEDVALAILLLRQPGRTDDSGTLALLALETQVIRWLHHHALPNSEPVVVRRRRR